jgi:hypothetical protein
MADKPGRNDDCWCGSGKKYKKCHLAEDEMKERKVLAEKAAEIAAKLKADQEKDGEAKGGGKEAAPELKPKAVETHKAAKAPMGAARQVQGPRKMV